jgi:hypothetical protein
MPKFGKKIDPSSGQLSLFDVLSRLEKRSRSTDTPRRPSSFCLDQRLREELSQGLKRSSLSRYQVAARMSELMGVEVSKAQLDSWTAESKENHRFPAAYLPAFCEATGHREPLRIMAELINCYLVESQDALFTELGRIKQKKEELTERERTIRQFLKESERR